MTFLLISKDFQIRKFTIFIISLYITIAMTFHPQLPGERLNEKLWSERRPLFQPQLKKNYGGLKSISERSGEGIRKSE